MCHAELARSVRSHADDTDSVIFSRVITIERQPSGATSIDRGHVISAIGCASAKMLEIRWAGYDGSRGKYAAPLFQTAHSAINASRDLSTHTPTIRSAVTPLVTRV